MGKEPEDGGIEPIETSPIAASLGSDDDGIETIETDWEQRDLGGADDDKRG